MRKFNIYNETTYNLKKEERVIKSMLKHMIRHEKLKNIYFNVIIVDNPYIHKINKEYINIDREGRFYKNKTSRRYLYFY